MQGASHLYNFHFCGSQLPVSWGICISSVDWNIKSPPKVEVDHCNLVHIFSNEQYKKKNEKVQKSLLKKPVYHETALHKVGKICLNSKS